MRVRYAALLAICLPLYVASSRADDDGMTSFHYMDLYNIQQSVASLQDLKALRVVLYVTSTRPDVDSLDIALIMHHASGAQERIYLDVYGRARLPVSDALKAENPLIVTNQPKHSLQASVVIDLVPPEHTDLRYDALMLGVTQLNEAMVRQRLGAMAKLYGQKVTGLLIFYNGGEHSLTLHEKAGDQVLGSTRVDQVLSRLKHINTHLIPPNTQIIYVPLDKALMQEDPRVTLDALPTQTFPAF